MAFYEKYILPKISESLCSSKPITYQRKKVVPLARGRVLEIGIGSGLNFPFYDTAKVDFIWGVDPSEEVRKKAEKRAVNNRLVFEFIESSGNGIPLESNSVDTVLVTYSLCTIPDVFQALGEMRRVLISGGELIFCEHGLAPDGNVRRWQNRLNPIWRRLGGGCNLNRPIPELIEQGGFKIHTMETMYIPGWKPACFNYWGTAVEK
jgi:ubiquinone/menaquinone biosynthesis C-methylase UbiE